MIRTLVAVLGVLLAFGALGTTSYAAPIGVDLVTNGNFETGDLTGWTGTGAQVAASSVPGSSGLADPNSIGSWVAQGTGISSGMEMVFQLIDLSANSANIDSGVLEASLGADLLSEDAVALPGNAEAFPQAIFAFEDGGGSELSRIALTIDPGTVGGWDEFRFARNVIPVGTRQVRVLLEILPILGDTTQAFSDNITFALNPVPEPSTTLLLMLTGLAWTLRRPRPA